MDNKNKKDNNINIKDIKDNEREKENIYQEILNNLNNSNSNNNENNNNNQKKEKNFSQQVDFLYHRDNPEGQSSIKNILIKQYKKHSKLPNENLTNKKKKYSKSYPKKKIIPYNNKNKGLFDPYLSGKDLDYESNIEKQRAERQKKIDEYEKNNRKKKLKKEINKKILNFEKPRINSAKNKKNIIKNNKKKLKKEELITHFMQVPKPKIKKNLANNFGFFPKKYDMIINSLINEMNEGKKENFVFQNKIHNYARKNIDTYNDYYEFVYNNQINNLQNNKNKFIKIDKNAQKAKPTRAEIIKGLMQKYFGKENNKQNEPNEINIKINEIKEKSIIIKTNKLNKSNKKENSKDNNINNNLLLDLELDENNDEINYDNIDKLLSSEKLNFQDKINIISELNKNIDKYSKEMPIIFNQVKDSLDKIYKPNQNDINFIKEVNKVPYIAMASKSAYQIIQTNMDSIIEKIINELLFESAVNLNEINQKKLYIFKKQELINEINLAKNNLNDLIGNEKNIFEENIKLFEDKKDKINKINNQIDENQIFNKKYMANIDEDIIKRNDKYKDDFKEYMVFKGSFYAKNIFNIYDEFIEEESELLLDKIINQFIDKLKLNMK